MSIYGHTLFVRIFPYSNLIVRREYIPNTPTYIFLRTTWKGVISVRKTVDHYEIIMHYPKDEAGRQELAKRVALVHAQTVIEKLNALSCPIDEKVRVIDEIIKKCSKTR